MVNKIYISERGIIMMTTDDKLIIAKLAAETSGNTKALINWGGMLYRKGLIKGWAIGVGGCLIGSLIGDYVTNRIMDKKSETK